MEVDLLIFQMAVIFLPRIIWARLDARFAAKEKLSNVDFVLNAFVFGVATYAVEFLIYAAFRWPFKMADFGNASSQEIVTKDVVIEILWALVIGIILSLVWLFASNHKWLSRFLQKFRFTKNTATKTCGTSRLIQVTSKQSMSIFVILSISLFMPAG